MLGDKVIVRTFGGTPAVRRVVAIGERVIYACTEDRFNRIKNGDDTISPVGFPIQDIFVYAEDQYALIEEDNSAWNLLTLWYNHVKRGNKK